MSGPNEISGADVSPGSEGREDEVGSILARVARGIRRSRAWTVGTLLAACGFAPSLGVGPLEYLANNGLYSLGLHWNWPISDRVAWAAGCAAGMLVAAALRLQASVRLSRLRGVEATGRLVEALDDPDRDLRSAAGAVLERLLRGIGSDARLSLSPAQYGSLLSVLRVAPAGMALTILSALETIGDHRALTTITAVAAGRCAAGGDRRVRDAAVHALGVLAASGQSLSGFIIGDQPALDDAVDVAAAPDAILAGLLSADPGLRSKAVRQARALDRDSVGRVLTGVVRRVRWLRAGQITWHVTVISFLIFSMINSDMGDAARRSMADGVASTYMWDVWSDLILDLLQLPTMGVLLLGAFPGLAERIAGTRSVRQKVQSIASQVVDGTAADAGSDEASDLVQALLSDHLGIRARALRRLRNLSIAGRAAVADGLVQALQAVQRQRRRRWRFVAIPIPALLILSYDVYISDFLSGWMAEHTLTLGVSLSVALLLAWPLFAYGRRLRHIVSALLLVDSAGACGALLDAARNGDRDVRRRAMDALPGLLSRAGPDDLADLTGRQLAYLESLAAGSQTPMALAALAALVHGGARRSLARIRRIATDPATLEQRPDVARAAERCADALEQRLAAAAQSSMLLRPAVAGPGKETLVRPVLGVSPVMPDRLLRPASGPAAAEDATAEEGLREPLAGGSEAAVEQQASQEAHQE